MDSIAIIAAAIGGAIGGGLGGIIATRLTSQTVRTAIVVGLAVFGAALARPLIKPQVEALLGPSLRAGTFDSVYSDQIVPEIKKVPALDRIFKDDPSVESAFKARARTVYEARGPQALVEESAGIGAELLGNAIARYLPRARTQDLIGFAKVMADVLGRMNDKDPEACILHQFGTTYGRPLATSRLIAAIGKDGQDKQIAALNDLVVNAGESPISFDKAKADAAIAALGQRHAPLLSGKAAEVAGGQRPPADVAEAKVACTFAHALFKDVSTMDEPTAELILRGMFAAMP